MSCDVGSVGSMQGRAWVVVSPPRLICVGVGVVVGRQAVLFCFGGSARKKLFFGIDICSGIVYFIIDVSVRVAVFGVL
jgi:hypothetical protein